MFYIDDIAVYCLDYYFTQICKLTDLWNEYEVFRCVTWVLLNTCEFMTVEI